MDPKDLLPEEAIGEDDLLPEDVVPDVTSEIVEEDGVLDDYLEGES